MGGMNYLAYALMLLLSSIAVTDIYVLFQMRSDKDYLEQMYYSRETEKEY